MVLPLKDITSLTSTCKRHQCGQHKPLVCKTQSLTCIEQVSWAPPESWLVREVGVHVPVDCALVVLVGWEDRATVHWNANVHCALCTVQLCSCATVQLCKCANVQLWTVHCAQLTLPGHWSCSPHSSNVLPCKGCKLPVTSVTKICGSSYFRKHSHDNSTKYEQ